LKLRKGKTKTILDSSIDSALLAVEIYNKPRTMFRSEGFITLMIMAWTRLFHAYFNTTIGDKYYFKKKNGRYEILDREKKAWDLAKCIKEYKHLEEAVEKNLQFFIRLRNKIEHRHIEKHEIDTLIFGECQSLLFNYENQLVSFFGDDFSINESLVYSLQFSHLRTSGQAKANKAALSKDLLEIMNFVQKYRNNLDEDVFNSQSYSIKLIQIPKISNTNRADAAIEFVRWDSLSSDDKEAFDQLNVLIKDKTVRVPVSNANRLRASSVIKNVNEQQDSVLLTQNLHVVLYKLFEIRPPNGSDTPFETNTLYCLYDETHGDYVYEEMWVDFLVRFLSDTDMTAKDIREFQKSGQKMDIAEYNDS